MPNVCAAYNCTNRSNKTSNISYFKFPLKNKLLTKKWVVAMKRENWYPTATSRICSSHFEDKFKYIVNDVRRLYHNAVPRNFNFPRHLQKRNVQRRPPTERVSEEMCVQVTRSADTLEAFSTPAVACNATSSQHDHTYCLPSPQKMKRKYDHIVEKLDSLQKKLKRSNQAAETQKRRVTKYQSVIKGLEKRLSETGNSVLLNSFTGVVKELLELQAKSHVSQYPSSVRKFALTLHFYSAHAYRYLRKFFKLPHPRTLRQWATTVGGNPGFTSESFVKLEHEVRNSSDTILCALVFDEMAIKKDLTWDGKEICGYVDLGHGYVDGDHFDLAREALVFMITALNRKWKIPVGYCLINGVTAAIKVNLIQQYLRKLQETGVNVVAVVCDGTATNRSMLQMMGVSFNGPNKKCWFAHPSDEGKKVYSFLDAAHMLKLMRNLLAEKQVLVAGGDTSGSNLVEWNFLKRLVDLQEEEGLHAANKLRKQNLQWVNQKMKVALAAETLSNSVANAILFCKEIGIQGFEGCESTTNFIKHIDSCFDLLNSCHPLGKGTKAPVTKNNKVETVSRIEKYISYLQNLKFFDGTFVHSSNRNVAISGLTINLMSLKGLCETYIWSQGAQLKYILTRRLSQDHLELFFASIRSRGGNRNNPNAVQFKAAYRKCLIAQVDLVVNGNCQASDLSVLDVSDVPVGDVNNELVNYTASNSNVDYSTLSLYSENVVEYIAGSVVRQLFKKMNCVGCLATLYSNAEKSGLIKIKDKGGLFKPSRDVVTLCKVAEKVFHNNINLLHKKSKNVLLKLQVEAFSFLTSVLFSDSDHVFTATELNEESHYVRLVKDILKCYFSCRINYFCKNKSAEERGKQIRQTFTKLVLFKGQ